jgi:hypothetical protein
MAPVNASFAALTTNNCQTGANCKSNAACAKDFAIVLTHHDHCLANTVPKAIEDGLHDFEEKCDACHITRKFDPKLTACPVIACNATADHAAAIAFLNATTNNCKATNCAGECAAPWKRLRFVHDNCDEDDVPRNAEAMLHELEDACAANDCNAAEKDEAPKCIPHDKPTTAAPAPGDVVCKSKSCADCVKEAKCSWCDSARAASEKISKDGKFISTGSCTQGDKCLADKAGLDVKFATCRDSTSASAIVVSIAAAAVAAVFSMV